MRILIHIKIPADGIDPFLAYEERVLSLIPNYCGTLLQRYRSGSGEEEFHVVDWPSADHFDRFRNDPDRIAAKPLWDGSGATARIVILQD